LQEAAIFAAGSRMAVGWTFIEIQCGDGHPRPSWAVGSAVLIF
jgi:hypothetical protein